MRMDGKLLLFKKSVRVTDFQGDTTGEMYGNIKAIFKRNREYIIPTQQKLQSDFINTNVM